MNIHVQLDPKDFLESQQLHMGLVDGVRIPTLVLVPVVFLLLLLPVGFLWLTGRLDPDLFESLRYAGPMLAILAVLAVLYYFYLRWNVRRIFKQQKDLSKPYEVELTPEAFIAFSEYGYSKRPWGDFHKWKEDDKLLLLYFSDVLYTIVPKRFASDEQLAEMRLRLSEHHVPDAGHGVLAGGLMGQARSRWRQVLIFVLLLIAVGYMLYLGFRQP